MNNEYNRLILFVLLEPINFNAEEQMLASKKSESSETLLVSSNEELYKKILHLFTHTISFLNKDYLEISLLKKIWIMCGGLEIDFESAIDSMEKSQSLSKEQMPIQQEQNHAEYIKKIVTILFGALNINFRDAHENHYHIFQIEEIIKNEIFRYYPPDKKIKLFLIASYYYTKLYALKIAGEYLALAENTLLLLPQGEYSDIHAQFHVVKMYMGIFDCNDAMIESSNKDLQDNFSDDFIKQNDKLYHELRFCILTESSAINATERIKFLIEHIDQMIFLDKSVRSRNEEVIARRSLAQAYMTINQFEHATQQSLLGIEIAISTNTETKYAEMGALYNILGDIMYNIDNPDRNIDHARLYFEQCIEFYYIFPNLIPPIKVLLHAFYRLSNIHTELSFSIDLEASRKHIKSAYLFKKNFSDVAHQLHAILPNKHTAYLKEMQSKITEAEKHNDDLIREGYESAIQEVIESHLDNIELNINKNLLLTVRYSKKNKSIYFKIHGDFNSHFYDNLKQSLYINNLQNNDEFICGRHDILCLKRNFGDGKNEIKVNISNINFFTIHLDINSVSVRVMLKLSVSQERQLYTKPIQQCSSWVWNKRHTFITDLHTHFDAILPGEILIKLPNATQHIAGNINDNNKFLHQLSLPYDRPVNFIDLEDAYNLREIVTGKIEFFAEILHKTAQYYKEQEIFYAELSMHNILLPSWLSIAFDVMPEIEEKTGVKLRFLIAIYNYSTEKEADISRIKIAMQCPYIVGVDFAGYENTDIRPINHYVKKILKWANDHQLDLILRIHAGETKLFQKNVESIINFAEIYRNIHIRIGHGVYDITDELLSRVALIKNRCIFEFLPDSNIALGVIDDFNEFPLVRLFEKNIPFVIGSDGYGFYRSNVENLYASVIDLIASTRNVDKIFDFIHQTEINYIRQQNAIFKKKAQLIHFNEIISSINKMHQELKPNNKFSNNTVVRSITIRNAYDHITDKTPIAIISDYTDMNNKGMFATIELIDRYFASLDGCNSKLCILLLFPDKFIDHNSITTNSKILIQKISTKEMLARTDSSYDTSECLALGETIETFVSEVVNYVTIRDGMFITLGDNEWIKSIKLRLHSSLDSHLLSKFKPSDLYYKLKTVISRLSDQVYDSFRTPATTQYPLPKFIIDHYYNISRYSKLIARNNDLKNVKYINTLLLSTAEKGQLALVKICIHQHADIESVDKRNNTPLMLALTNGHSDIAEFLLDSNANISGRNASNFSALEMAVCENNLKIASMIISKLIPENMDPFKYSLYGSLLNYAISSNCTIEIIKLLIPQADLCAIDFQGNSALHLAAINDDYKEIIHILLDLNMNIDAVNNAGYTPLMIACGSSPFIWGYICPNNAKLLLCKGAKIHITDKNERTALHHAALLVDCYEIIKLIIQNVENSKESVEEYVNKRSISGETTLLLAAINNNVDTVAFLIKHGAKVDVALYDNGHTPLVTAVICNNIGFVKAMIKHGANVNVTCLYEYVANTTPLMIALEKGYLDIAHILIEANADIHSKNNKNMTALSFAAQKNNYEIVQLLINLGADVNIIDEYSCTPLFYAVHSGNDSIVSALIKANAYVNPMMTNESNFTHIPLLTAAISSHKIFWMLMNAGAEVNFLIYGYPIILKLVCCIDDIDRLKALVFFIKAGADINGKTHNGTTALMYFSSRSYFYPSVRAAKILLEAGADVNSKDNDGNTALIYAIENYFIDMIEVLLQYGANVNVENVYKQTPLMFAASRCPNMCLILIQAGADILAKDSNNNTPRNIAIQSDRREILVVLEQAHKFSKVSEHLLLFSNNVNLMARSSTEFSTASYNESNLAFTKFS